jgi:hypothetical protein
VERSTLVEGEGKGDMLPLVSVKIRSSKFDLDCLFPIETVHEISGDGVEIDLLRVAWSVKMPEREGRV